MVLGVFFASIVAIFENKTSTGFNFPPLPKKLQDEGGVFPRRVITVVKSMAEFDAIYYKTKINE